MTSTIIYTGNLRCQATHIQSKSIIETDAPTDNKGKGEKFSPTDLLCVSLATCITTTIAIKATDMEIDIANTTMQVTKHMLSDPRRIGKIEINLKFPNSLKISEKDKTILQRVGNTCPVSKSLHPNMSIEITYNW
ncbi:MAG: OsmC family protein [Ferruginibacter sp.]|nr:OsmC family protein [Ferruginibacter sp.]